jgi:translation initiation factor IF-1
MVKNEKGGNKSKKLGRKHVNDTTSGKSGQNIHVRFAKEEGEMYAVVSKNYGSNMCLVECADGVARNCIIRKKFTGRRKKDNIISPGVWILVGTRDWEVLTAGKKPKCDLLEVYSSEEKIKLEGSSHIDVRRLSKLAFSDNKDEEDFSCDFISSETSLYEKILAETDEGDGKDDGINIVTSNKTAQTINIDDI